MGAVKLRLRHPLSVGIPPYLAPRESSLVILPVVPDWRNRHTLRFDPRLPGDVRGVLQHQAQPLTAASALIRTLIEIPRVAIKRDLRAYQFLLDTASKEAVP